MKLFKRSLLLLMACSSLPLFAQPVTHKRVHPKATALPFHDFGEWDFNMGSAPSYAIHYLCQCLTGSLNLNLDTKSFAVRPRPKAIAFGWEYIGKYGDNFSCVYDVKHATLTTIYTGMGTPYGKKSCLYHVTLSVLEAAARQPVDDATRTIDFEVPFAPLLKYGARLKP